MFFLGFFFGSGCAGQDGGKEVNRVDRQAAVAGQFYPSQPAELKADLKGLFDKARPMESSNVLAIIAPHAGYVFSGQVAASSFNQVDPERKYENIFILASSHRYSFDGASVYNKGDYVTPLGAVKVNTALADELLKADPSFNARSDAHLYEHSLEVQLPFLQYRLGNDIQIVPVILGTQNAETCKAIAAVLQPYLNNKNLFVISSDFSHYPEYEDAVLNDKITADAIITNSPDLLMRTLAANEDKHTPGLVTSLCGWTSVLTLLYMTEGEDVTYKEIDYMNSGDSETYGEKDRVVGYFSIAVEGKTLSASYSLTEDEKSTLLHIARSTMEEYVSKRRIPDVDARILTPALLAPTGAFVTLKKDSELRGCIGRFDAELPLWQVVQRMSIAASTEDYRFSEVTPDEFDEIHIEISVLTPLRKINSIDEFELGKHGIYMKKGMSSGTFLPQVAEETGWTREEFLGHCARDKTHIGWDGWKTAELFVYEAFIFGE
jgi:AmmeMemoRadiSam system protein B/AmmeMemoRadiSam system protein A